MEDGVLCGIQETAFEVLSLDWDSEYCCMRQGVEGTGEYGCLALVLGPFFGLCCWVVCLR